MLRRDRYGNITNRVTRHSTAPTAYFSFGGLKQSPFGDLRMHGVYLSNRVCL